MEEAECKLRAMLEWRPTEVPQCSNNRHSCPAGSNDGEAQGRRAVEPRAIELKPSSQIKQIANQLQRAIQRKWEMSPPAATPAAESVGGINLHAAAESIDAAATGRNGGGNNNNNNNDDDPKTVTSILTSIKTHAGGTKNFKEALQVLKETDDNNLKGDVLVPIESNGDDSKMVALEKLKAMIHQDRIKQKLRSNKRMKWRFGTSPHEYFGKTLDDTFWAFLNWAKIPKLGPDGRDEDEGVNDQEYQYYNVSKAFRRLESYATWMEESSEEILVEPLTAASVKRAFVAWTTQFDTSKDGKLVWYFDMSKVDFKFVKKELSPTESIRSFVWLAHYTMYDRNAQQHGVVLCENLNRIGFVDAITLMPSKVKAKLDKMMMGCLPIKMKQFIFTNPPNWMNIWMKFVLLFLSNKMKQRFVIAKDASQVTELLGSDNIPDGFAAGGAS